MCISLFVAIEILQTEQDAVETLVVMRNAGRYSDEEQRSVEGPWADGTRHGYQFSHSAVFELHGYLVSV